MFLDGTVLDTADPDSRAAFLKVLPSYPLVFASLLALNRPRLCSSVLCQRWQCANSICTVFRRAVATV